MSTHFLHGVKGTENLAVEILMEALKDAEIRQKMHDLLSDKHAYKKHVYCTAFVQGAICALSAIAEGRVNRVFPENN
jgi:hypothetical protein